MNQSARFTAVPRISFEELPEAEREEARRIVRLLSALSAEIKKIEADLKLFRFARESARDQSAQRRSRLLSGGFKDLDFGDPFAEWVAIATRDASMNMIHFEEILIGIVFKDCPSFRELVDCQKLRDARRVFRSSFPHARGMRDSVAHLGEFAAKPTGARDHAVSAGIPGFHIAEGSSVNIGHGISGDTVFTTFRGVHDSQASVRSFQLDEATIAKLNEIYGMTCAAFVPAAEATRILRMERRADMAKPTEFGP